jgi:asparagine synthase (glutamine-hydrolysing)
MSGILGVWNSQQRTPWQIMLDDLQVQGRDGQGDWHDVNVGLSLGRTQFFNTPESCHETPVVESLGCVLVWSFRRSRTTFSWSPKFYNRCATVD